MRNEIVVGLDDSPSGKAALDWAAEQARSVGAVLRAVHVLDWPYGLSPAGFPAPANFMDVSPEELQDSYRRWITAVFDAHTPSASTWSEPGPWQVSHCTSRSGSLKAMFEPPGLSQPVTWQLVQS